MTFTPDTPRPSDPVARLGATHSYQLEGDIAHITAEILCDESRLVGQQWALQLWSDNGIMIAGLPLGLLQPNGSGCLMINGSTTARPPAGDAAHLITLVLASGDAEAIDTVEDYVTDETPVQFLQPNLKGTVCCSFANDQITFDIAAIDNPRNADNVSGTLALELWVLETPYTGGAWVGVPVASLVLGTLNGQSQWEACQVSSNAGPLPADGYLTLMLREWTQAGYLTRDYRALTRPTAVSAPLKKKTAAPTKTKVETKPAGKPKAAKKEATPAQAEVVAPGVSINSASKAELAAVKGISKSVADAIIAARPYATLDELIRAKGLGPKMLEKISSSLKL